MSDYHDDLKSVLKEVPYTAWTFFKWGLLAIIVIAIFIFIGQGLGLISINIHREVTQHSQQYVETKVNLLNKLQNDWFQLDAETVELRMGDEDNGEIINAKIAQQKNIVKRMRTEADMIPDSQVPTSVRSFLSNHSNYQQKEKAMKRCILIGLILIVSIVFLGKCNIGSNAESNDRQTVNGQQDHYSKTQPLPFYDYSIPRDILIQIYNVVTQESRNTYTVIETIMGQTKYHGPSLGYGIPADVSITNPLRPTFERYHDGSVIEQAEPNGLFSSKNTDGTWVLFLDNNGDVTPVYTEHKVTTYPFAVKKSSDGSWVRADDKKASMTVKIKGRQFLSEKSHNMAGPPSGPAFFVYKNNLSVGLKYLLKKRERI